MKWYGHLDCNLTGLTGFGFNFEMNCKYVKFSRIVSASVAVNEWYIRVFYVFILPAFGTQFLYIPAKNCWEQCLHETFVGLCLLFDAC